MASLLDKTEAALLLSYEAVIERGLETFLEVGTALKAIADGRLYRSEHKTFDAYLDARWNMTRSWASRLIQAAEVVEALPIGNKRDVQSESQARELAKAPEGKRAETLAKAKESAAAQGRAQPTAKDIREAVDSGSVKTTPHDATQQEAEGPRRAVTDGDEGPCPKGGEHDIFTLHGGRYCGRCKAQFPADDGDDAEIVEGQVAFDFAGMRDTCQWWIDNCPGDYLVALAAEFDAWAKQVRGRL